MARSDARLTGDQEVMGLIPARSGNIFLMEIEHEIFSMGILSFLLIQEEQMSVSGQRRCTSTGLRRLSLP